MLYSFLNVNVEHPPRKNGLKLVFENTLFFFTRCKIFEESTVLSALEYNYFSIFALLFSLKLLHLLLS